MDNIVYVIKPDKKININNFYMISIYNIIYE